jgi:hypothetical protein
MITKKQDNPCSQYRQNSCYREREEVAQPPTPPGILLGCLHVICIERKRLETPPGILRTSPAYPSDIPRVVSRDPSDISRVVSREQKIGSLASRVHLRREVREQLLHEVAKFKSENEFLNIFGVASSSCSSSSAFQVWPNHSA